MGTQAFPTNAERKAVLKVVAMFGGVQARVAEAAGISKQIVSNYATGMRRPSKWSAQRLADISGMPRSAFRHDIDDIAPAVGIHRRQPRSGDSND